MAAVGEYTRLNLYLDKDLRMQVKIAAAHRQMSMSAYCVEAIRDQLAADLSESGSASGETRPANTVAEQRNAARDLDKLRTKLGRLGVPVHELVAEGRRR